MALLVVLSVLALISVLVLAFFSQANLNRQTSFASVGQARAENVAETALQTIVGDLREEMRAGSQTNAGAVYMPLTNLNMLPQRVVGAGFMNLVKESQAGSNAWSGPRFAFDGPSRSLGGNNTTNAAANGRYFPASRWLRPQLLLASETNLFQPPDWVVVTRLGPLTNAAAVSFAVLTNSAGTNLSYAVGRYAYTVYDIGGLLDANVAGYSSQSGLTSSDLARKGSLALVSLLGIGGLTQPQVDSFVQWRNPSAYNSYSNFAFNTSRTNGYLYPVPGNQYFLTRQDLIGYAASNGMAAALPYLTAFSREKNAPSWSPSTPKGSLIDYAAQAESSGAANRDMANFNFRDASGNVVSVQRFDLDRLRWLTYKGPSASLPASDPAYDPNGTAANILKYFGLVWDASAFKVDGSGEEVGEQWVYVSPDGSSPASPAPSIKTLDQVAARQRQPDFFELLKAGILSGSLGLYSQAEADLSTTPVSKFGGNVLQTTYRNDAAGNLFNKVPDYQIFNIAANILGQYSSDGYPPSIRSIGGNSIGVKSLPYELGHSEDAYRPSDGAAPLVKANPNRQEIYLWLRFVMWNPHRNATAAAPAVGPTLFRMYPGPTPGGGPLRAWMQNTYLAQSDKQAGFTTGALTPSGGLVDLTYTNDIEFPASPAFIDPTPLTYTNTTASTAEAYGSAGSALGRYQDAVTGKQLAGIFLVKQVGLDWKVQPGLSAGTTTSNTWADNPQMGMPTGATQFYRLHAQYKDWEGNWRSYQTYYNCVPLRRSVEDNWTPMGPTSMPYTNTASFGLVEIAHLDPRDRRFGPMGITGLSPDIENVYATFENTPGQAKTTSLYTVSGTNFFGSGHPSNYVNNVNGGGSYYKDMDGIVRPGDAGGRGGASPVNLSASAGQSRPLVLNGPFRSVADLGYTFRDIPWKSLDFATTNSADAGLLDFFGQLGGTPADLPVVAGKVNLNSAPAPILQALLNGAALDLQGDGRTVTGTLSSGDLSTLMNALRPTGGNPPAFVNKADLVSFFATNMPAAHTLKAEREAPVRALANVVQTRTWNLLIDVVAQSGRYLPSATDVNQFMVEGERHYWLQVAIDRFTGEIVDQQLEPVYEQ